jgi:hypothetical protein
MLREMRTMLMLLLLACGSRDDAEREGRSLLERAREKASEMSSDVKDKASELAAAAKREAFEVAAKAADVSSEAIERGREAKAAVRSKLALAGADYDLTVEHVDATEEERMRKLGGLRELDIDGVKLAYLREQKNALGEIYKSSVRATYMIPHTSRAVRLRIYLDAELPDPDIEKLLRALVGVAR